ncbi:MAG: class I SAM-dependent methyltransferase [Candidatus Melainabacteria bacterium]|nr:class I SAM-dependent methyltransferase [Candidatus Melainabacteria bacterium]
MDSKSSNKENIKNFWNNSPCGIRNVSEQEGTKEFFEKVEKNRYELDPFLPQIAQFNRWKDKKCLEVGCGVGTDFIQFLRGGADIYGVDFSEKSVSLARNRLELFGFDKERIKIADAENLPFPENHFDFIYSWGVLHHTLNIDKALAEVHRVLKQNGKICIMLYHKVSLVALQLYVFHGLLKLNPFRGIDEILANCLESPGTRAFTKAELKKLFKGFSDLDIQTVFTRTTCEKLYSKAA